MSKDLLYGLLLPPDSTTRRSFRLVGPDFMANPKSNALIVTDRRIQGLKKDYDFSWGLQQDSVQKDFAAYVKKPESISENHPLRFIRYLFILEGRLKKEKSNFADLSFDIWFYDTWENVFLGKESIRYRSEYEFEQENPYPESFCDSLKRSLYRSFYAAP